MKKGVIWEFLKTICVQNTVYLNLERQNALKFCKGDLSVIFLQPVAIKSEKTKRNDKNIEQLALEFNMTDIKSTKEGEHQTGYLKRNNKLTDKEFAQAGELSLIHI